MFRRYFALWMILIYFAIGLVLGFNFSVITAIVLAITACFLSFRFLIGEAPGESKCALCAAMTAGLLWAWIIKTIALIF